MASERNGVSTVPQGNYKITSQWMDTYVQQIPEVDSFASIDMLNGPVILFTQKNAGRLFLLQPGNKNGLLDLSKALKVAHLTVTAFDTSISKDGRSLHVALIAQDKNNALDLQQLVLTRAVTEDDIYDGSKWAASALRESSDQGSHFSKVHLTTVRMGSSAVSSGADGSELPNTVVEVKTSTAAAGNPTTEIACLLAGPGPDNFTVQWIGLPSRPDSDSDIFSYPGKLHAGSGTFLSYLTGKERFCTFVADRPDRFGYNVFPSVRAQDRITSMKALVRSDGLTDLLLAGPLGLYRYTAESFSKLNSAGTKILSGSVTHVHPTTASVATRADIWAVVNDQELGYLTVESIKPVGPVQAGRWTPISLGAYKRFRPSIAADGQLRRICSVNDGGHLISLERSTAGIWTEKQVAMLPMDDLTMVPAYITCLRFYGRDALPKVVRLTATSSMTCIVNHKAIVIDTNGTDVETDRNGVIEVANETTAFTGPQLSFQQYGIVEHVNPETPDVQSRVTDYSQVGPPVPIDVSSEVRKRLDRLPTSANDLKGLTFRDPFTGQVEKVFGESPSIDFSTLATNVGLLKTWTNRLPKDGSPVDVEVHPEHPRFTWDYLHVVETIKHGVLKVFVEAGHLIVEIAGEIKVFAMSCLEHALKAFSTLLQSAGATWKSLLNLLGWVFNWSDIRTMKNNLALIMTTEVEVARQSAINWFQRMDEALENQIGKASETQIPLTSEQQKMMNEFHGDARDHQDTEKQLATHGEKDAQQSHSASEYILSRLSLLLSGDSPLHNLTPALTAAGDIAQVLSNGKTASILSESQALITSLRATIRQIANTELHSLGDLLHALATSPLWIEALGLLRTLMSDVLRPVIGKLFDAVLASATSSIEVPFFSALYKHVTGHDLPSVLDLITFIIAVPATVLYSVTGSSKTEPISAWSQDDVRGLTLQQNVAKRSEPSNSELQPYIWTVNSENQIFKVVNTMQPFVVAMTDQVSNAFDAAKALDVTDSVDKMPWFRFPFAIIKFAGIGFNFPLMTQTDLTSTTVVLWRERAWLIDSLGAAVDILGLFSLEFGDLAGDLSTFVTGVAAFTFAQSWFAIEDIIGDMPAKWDDKTKQRCKAMKGLRFPEIISTTVSRCCYLTAQNIKEPIHPAKIVARVALAAGGSVGCQLAVACAVTRGGLICSLPSDYGNSRIL